MSISPATIQFIWEIGLNLLLAIISIVVALWYENLGAPRLEITTHITTDDVKADGRRVRFLHLSIKNKPRKAPFVTKQTAYSCHGNITFLNDNHEKVGQTIPIKWDGTPEPLRMEIVDGKPLHLLEPSLLRYTRYIDIPPDEGEGLALAVRIFGDENAYGWTGESYAYSWRHPGALLPPGRYIARVYITTGDEKFSADYRFNNPNEFEQFDLISE